MINNIVGIKPTPGLISNRGMVPACESLDCVSIFALSVSDGAAVRRVAEGYDAADPWSRHATVRPLPRAGLRIGVLSPADREFLGHDEHAALYAEAIAGVRDEIVEIDYAPFREVAALLYEGPWVAERQAALDEFGVPASAVEPTVARVLAGAARFSAVDCFAAFHRLERLRRACEAELASADVLLLPTAPCGFTVEEMLAGPIARNSALGLYTNFCNLLGLAAIAVPAGFTRAGLAFGVTLVGPAFSDEAIGMLAHRLHLLAESGSGVDRGFLPPPLPVAPGDAGIELAVVGAHLSGMPLNHQLQALDAQLVARGRTTGDYRLFVLPRTNPRKPGLIRSPGLRGPGIELEIWSLDAQDFGRFVAAIPAPLGIGKIALAGGGEVDGFLCEAWAVEDAQEITQLGSWRAFCALA